MLEQDSLEGSGTQGEGRAATAAQVSGLGMPDRSSWEEETFLSHGFGSGSPVCTAPPSQHLWGLQQWPLKEMEC